MTTAFLFAGQGSQTEGMGEELRRRSPAAQKLFEEADAACGFPLTELMCEGSAEELRRTEVAQPAVLSVGVAEARELLARGVAPAYLAGHSLGQYAALVVAGALDFATALELVVERGRLMQRAVPEGHGAMLAVVGASRDAVRSACAAARPLGVVDVACHNSDGQTVISGSPAAVDAAAEALEEEGAGVVPLDVSAPFHCALLEPVRGPFRARLEEAAVSDPQIPVVDNVTARPLPDARSVRDSLTEQITAPVLFEESLRWLVERGVARWVQCGPGRQLLGFARRIDAAGRFESAGEIALGADPPGAA